MNIPDLSQVKTLIFDLDGVITSESKYWNAARLTVWELIADQDYLGLEQYFDDRVVVEDVLRELGQKIISNDFIYQLKSRAINSNWDLTFFVVCLHLVAIFSHHQKHKETAIVSLFRDDNGNSQEKLHTLGKSIQPYHYSLRLSDDIIQDFWRQTEAMTGGVVLKYVDSFAAQYLGENFTYFNAKGELWQLCYDNFQAWYEGRKGYHLPDDETVLDLAAIDTTLSKLHQSGRYQLAIATGRPRNEVIEPFQILGLLNYFELNRIVTYDEVLEAEAKLVDMGLEISLGKPHPYILFKAIYPDGDVQKLCDENFQFKNPQDVIYIGDAGSDVVAAKRAGCLSIGVLTGFSEGKATQKKRQMLMDLGCDIILDSILDLPYLLGV